LTTDDIIWMGPQPSLVERCEKIGVRFHKPFSDLKDDLKKAVQSRKRVHFVPQYRADNIILLANIFNITPETVNDATSIDFIKAIVEQRSRKSAGEIEEIEKALETTYEMHTYALKNSKPGTVEQEIVGAMEGIAVAGGGHLSFPIIFSIHGETLHNHSYGNTMQAGDILVCDCGAESAMHYAGDMTRTIPVSGKFSEKQKEIYEIVLRAEEKAIDAVKANIKFLDVHLISAKEIAGGLKEIGIMKGNPDDIVAAGAHALFYPHGLGHMMGLDVHDMENLGEDLVGYDDEVQRSDQFGLSGLRIGRRLQEGFVMTIEPGIYFVPALIDRWKTENKFTNFINYDLVEKYRDFGGVRIEDDVVVTKDGCRILGKAIPKRIPDIETMTSS